MIAGGDWAVPPSRLELGGELARLLGSKTFSASGRSRQLLEYFVGHLLQETADKVKEYSIGVDVFDRAPSYDPQLDTIARTETWRLRSKLAAYYRDEGKDNPLRIGFRLRSLVPVAEYRSREVRPGAWPAALRAVQRIAVLPFTDVGNQDPDFNVGLASDVMVGLRARSRLEVVSRMSSCALKRLDLSASEIASRLDADLLVEGSVQGGGGDLRVTLNLTEGASGVHIHSAVYDRRASPGLRMQQELANQIVAEIDGAILARTVARVGGAQHGSFLDSLLRMRFQLAYQPDASTELAELVTSLRSAAQSQPMSRQIRRAYSISAANFLSLGGAAMPEIVSHLLAQPDPSKGDPQMVVEARVSAAMVAMFRGDYGGAAEMLSRAVELDAADAMAHLAQGIVLLHAGRLEDALKAMSTGQALDPLSALNASMLATVLFSLRRFDAAHEQVSLCLALDPHNMMAHALLADIDMARGDYDIALSKSFTFCRMSNGHPLALGKLGYAYGLQGRHAEVRSIMNRLLAQADEPGRVAPSIALAYLGLGDRGKALSWMRTAAEQNTLVDIIPSMPFYDALRSDSNFTALMPALN